MTLSVSRGRRFISVNLKHQIAEPPSPSQYCTHSLIVRWADGWRGVVWQVQR